MNVWRRELGLRVHAARKARMRRLSYTWLAWLREIVIDSQRCPLTFPEHTLKEFERNKEGNWIDDIPDPTGTITRLTQCAMPSWTTCFVGNPQTTNVINQAMRA